LLKCKREEKPSVELLRENNIKRDLLTSSQVKRPRAPTGTPVDQLRLLENE